MIDAKTCCIKCGAPKTEKKCKFCGFISEESNGSTELFSKTSVADMDFDSGNYSTALERYEKLIDKSASNLYVVYKRAVSQFYVNEINEDGSIRCNFNNYFALFKSLRKVFESSDSEEIKTEIRAQSKKILAQTYDYKSQFFIRYKSLGAINIIDSTPYKNFTGNYNFVFETIIYFYENKNDEFQTLINESIYFKHQYLLELLSAYIDNANTISFSLVEESLDNYIKNNKNRLSTIGAFHTNHVLIILNYLTEDLSSSQSQINSLLELFCSKSEYSTETRQYFLAYDEHCSKKMLKASHFYKNEEKINEIINQFNTARNRLLNPVSTQSSSSNCFIATAAMGDYNHPVVMDLRMFRDNWLLKRKWGISFTNWYYTHGPKAARIIEQSKFLRKITFCIVIKPLQVITKLMR